MRSGKKASAKFITLKQANKIAPLLYALQTCRSQQDQRILASYLDTNGMRHLTEAINLVVNHPNDLKIHPSRRTALKRLLSKDKYGWLKMAGKKGSLKSKQNFIAKQKGGALPAIIATAAPFVIDLIRRALS